MSDPLTPEIIPINTAALAVQAQAEIESAIATAQRFPRNIDNAIRAVEASACFNKEVAKSCSYAKLIGGGKYAKGASVRLAEMAYIAWGNLACTASIIEDGGTYIVAQAKCRDLEKNIMHTVEVRRNVVYGKNSSRRGQRYDDAMIETTCNAAMSIARRNVILLVIPRSFIEDIRQKAIKTSLGKDLPISDRRQAALDRFEKDYGVKKEQLCRAIRKAAVNEWTFEDIDTLLSIYSSIHNGEMTVADAFPEPEATAEDMTMPGAQAANIADAAGVEIPEEKPDPEQPPEPKKKPASKPKKAKAVTDDGADANYALLVDMLTGHASMVNAETSGPLKFSAGDLLEFLTEKLPGGKKPTHDITKLVNAPVTVKGLLKMLGDDPPGSFELEAWKKKQEDGD